MLKILSLDIVLILLGIVSLCDGQNTDEALIVPLSNQRSAELKKACLKYDDEQDQVTFPKKNDCGVFFKCVRENETSPILEVRCAWGFWYDDVSGSCKAISTFSAERQHRCFRKIGAAGTSKNFREIIIGRCWNYQLFEHPEFFESGYKDCEKIYNALVKAFANKSPCGQVKFGDYDEFFKEASVENTPTDKLLFWSSINQFSQDYSNRGKRLFTLENTLPGFLINQLTWCGQETGSGINFRTCPPWGICEHHPMVTFWEQASIYFGTIAKETASLMLDGSLPNRDAFRPNSFFASFELPALKPDRVKKIEIFVVHRPGRKIRETCISGSLLDLKVRLAKRGFTFTCQDNPADILHLLCVDSPEDKICKKRIRPLQPQKKNGEIFGYEVSAVEQDKK